MNNRDPFISRFSPNRTPPEELENIHVDPKDLLQDTLQQVRKSLLGGKLNHLLYVGTRGSGKTHRVSLLVHRLKKDEKAMGKTCIAWLNEDETSLSYAELLVRVFQALTAEHPELFEADDISQAYELGAEAAIDYLEKQLVKRLGSRKVLVLVENLDALMDTLDVLSQRAWRAFLQDSKCMLVVATAQRMTDKLIKENEVFHGFFKVRYLKAFSVDEAVDLLAKLAASKGDGELVNFIRTRKGRARVRALHHLSGGNPRLYIVLSDFITKASLEELVRPFEELVDECLTPYYQERLRWLSPQQRRLVEVLCQIKEPYTVAALSKKIFAAENTVSGQLKKLRDMGYVDSNKIGRDAYYELREPLMRISMQVKDARGEEPLELIIDFLKVWYDREELESRVGSGLDKNFEQTYLLPVIYALREEGPLLRHQLIRKDVLGVDPHSCTEEERERLYEVADETLSEDDLFRAMIAAVIADDFPTIKDYISKLELIEDLSPQSKFALLSSRGLLLLFIEDEPEKAIVDFRAALDMDVGDELKKFIRLQLSVSYAKSGNWCKVWGTLHQSNALGLKDRTPYLYVIANEVFFQGQDRHGWYPEAKNFFTVLSDLGALGVLGNVLIRQLKLLAHSKLSHEGLEEWCSLWEELGANEKELIYSLRLFRAGINYIKTGELKELLRLPKEARLIVEQALEITEDS